MENNSENWTKSKSVETYTDDMVKAIENDKGGLIKKIIHEEEEHEARKNNLSPNSKRNRMFMIVGATLIICGLLLLIFLAFFYKENSTAIIPTSTEQSSSLIFTEKTSFKEVDGLSREKIIQNIFDQTNNTKVKVGGIEGVYLTEGGKVTGFKKFISLIKGNLTSSEFISENFLIGIFKSGVKASSPDAGDLFILLKTRSFADVFPIMKSWENKMFYDLASLFGTNLSSETKYLFTKEWDDSVIENKNARILYDKNGNIVLMYIFVNDTNIVITNSKIAAREVIDRLTSSKIKK